MTWAACNLIAANTSSAVKKPETALEKSLAPREPFAINMTLNISFVTWID